MDVPLFGMIEQTFEQEGSAGGNPYTEIEAVVRLTAPAGTGVRELPLFWDGGGTWRFRFAPDRAGAWQWVTESSEPGLDGHEGTFEVVPSERKGGLRTMEGYPHHLERQDGSRFWFLGETAWALFLDNQATELDQEAVHHYIDVRAEQGFNMMHSMLMSELGWGNAGGDPFDDMAAEQINPAYWQEVDERLAYLNEQGLIGGLVLAWGRKQWQEANEPFAWDHFPDLEAKQRYARYIAARYGAYDVYFIVAGEWNASTGAEGRDHDAVREEYVAIGDALHAADAHDRMVAIHPGTGGVHFVREFNEAADWMSFGDYQQNYTDLHDAVVASRRFEKPVVNGEYAYYLRDQRQDGVVDKANSQTLETIRHATWDIVMAGGYVVSGFGSTYLGGARHPGPFDVDSPINDDWEGQIQHVKAFFTAGHHGPLAGEPELDLDWWRLEPHDELILADLPRSGDIQFNDRTAPPRTTYWCLAAPGHQYVLYVRGLTSPANLTLDARPWTYRVHQYNPRLGLFEELGLRRFTGAFSYDPPDAQDWVVVLEQVPTEE